MVPHGDKWAVKKEKSKKAEVFRSKKEAVQTARNEAKQANASVTVQRKHGKIESRQSYNPNRKASKQS